MKIIMMVFINFFIEQVLPVLEELMDMLDMLQLW
jgi:hypothetical protein